MNAPIPIDRFAYVGTEDTLTAEVAELGDLFQPELLFPGTQAYGIRVEGRTGIARFVLTAVDRNGEDVAGWIFLIHEPDAERLKVAVGLRILVIND